MKKGFTLIELLAVIIILGLIATLTTPIVLKSINDAKDKAYNTQIAQIKKAAKDWSLINTECIKENTSITLKLGRLKYGSDYNDNLECPNDEGGFIEVDIKNPKTGEQFDDELAVIIVNNGNKYEYIIEIGNDDTLPTFIVTPDGWSKSKFVTILYPNGGINEYSIDSGVTWISYTEPINFTNNATIIARVRNGNTVILKNTLTLNHIYYATASEVEYTNAIDSNIKTVQDALDYLYEKIKK